VAAARAQTPLLDAEIIALLGASADDAGRP
jgi:hypothetical protein